MTLPESACYGPLFRSSREGLPTVNFTASFVADVLLWFIVLIFSLSFHESAHALVSDRCGDNTARLLGRISLNPIVHIDPIGTVLFPLVSAFTGIPLFGWAKPTPTNPLNWRDKDRSNILVSGAGPVSNFLLAAIFFGILKACLMAGVSRPNPAYGWIYDIFTGDGIMEPVTKILTIAVLLNINLGIFNLFPVPPLDGSHIVESLLPDDARRGYEQITQFPFNLVLFFALMSFGVFTMVSVPVMNVVIRLLLR